MILECFLTRIHFVFISLPLKLDKGRLNVYGIHFWNPQEGLVLGAIRWKGDQEIIGNLVLLTEDGGQTWQPILTESGGSRLLMLSRIEGFLFWGRLYYTADGGRNWRQLSIGATDVYFKLGRSRMGYHRTV
jgi:photosystem II stability/assembly factor-like uncharacterized protein